MPLGNLPAAKGKPANGAMIGKGTSVPQWLLKQRCGHLLFQASWHLIFPAFPGPKIMRTDLKVLRF